MHMPKLIRWLLDLWRTPEGFRGKPLGYALNQMGHGYLIGGLPTAIWGPVALVPLVIGYLAIVELPQFLLWGGELADGIEDTAHVATVAIAIAYGVWPALVAHALFVAAGSVARMQSGGTEDGN